MHDYVHEICLKGASKKNSEISLFFSSIALFSNLCSTYNLQCVDNKLGASGYIYCSEALGHRLWCNHVFVSTLLCQKVMKFEILDFDCNNSDHNLIMRQLEWSSHIQT